MENELLWFLASRRWLAYAGDVKAAFCQSLTGAELVENARKEKLFAQVPPGEPLPSLPKGTRVVELVKEIYGLPPGPRAWRNTFLHVRRDLQFTIHPLSPCVLTWYGKKNSKENKLRGMLLLQVDDIFVAGEGPHRR
eukprot:3727735-Amphidinium_carterae.1